MGTSASSSGPGSGVPFDPPWLDDILAPPPGDDIGPDDETDDDEPGDEQPLVQPIAPTDVAPSRRFYGARTALGVFARTGNKDALRRAVGHYSRKGMGGARNAASRMRTSARAGTSVYNILQSAREGTDPTINEWVTALTGRNASAQEISDEIIRRSAPTGGSQDEAACRESMAQAMEDLLVEDPSVDLFNLSDDDIWTLTEAFLGYEAFYRICLDIGQVFEDSKLSPRDRVARMNEMQDYLKAKIGAQVEALRIKTPKASSRDLLVILQTALQNTFAVYEGSI